ncbi:hypothetical protein GQ43DRAFT_376773 [Delitschia confertaspora ATCC 74209]|uniref:Nucleolar 27S pre-rRNA processing Urb2/Npa2 C-terminal domain-containing protein n=1 Tax=Delitschia confertaspora ATCC 74209 TaxID=1513339 RepID=A0A9P4MQR9_9PLEO|nr:hypothetical protein GQ43DRAFT_376773 [Delitschia confertaspora ATCC 74209]
MLTLPQPAPSSLSKLQSIDKTFHELNDQISQAVQIIKLPSEWDDLRNDDLSTQPLDPFIRPRAEWVLRWILDKLKDDAETGLQARANPKAWRLLERMIQISPLSRAAMYLRDGNFPAILEKALQENFGSENIARITFTTTPEDEGFSSETVQEGSVPSRKRKRPTSGAHTPVKKVMLEQSGLEWLFAAIVRVVKAITSRANSAGTADETVIAEHIKMVLRTDSTQAARILKFWLIAFHRILVSSSDMLISNPSFGDYLGLSYVVEIWQLRTNHGESDTSGEDFALECLVPTLILYEALQDGAVLNTPSGAGERPSMIRNLAVQTVEGLLAKHLFAPSRTAFFTDVSISASSRNRRPVTGAKFFASCLGPLRAKLEQAAEINGANEIIPESLMPLFRAIPKLLDLAVRFSPSRTPMSQIAERPWIQAVFVALVNCLGCSLRPSENTLSKPSVIALQHTLAVLADRGISIESKPLEALFWCHSGVRYPLKKDRVIQWALIAGLVKLDPDIFLPSATTDDSASEERSDDLGSFLFDRISSIPVDDLSSTDLDGKDRKLQRGHNYEGLLGSNSVNQPKSLRELIRNSVILPVMSAFSRNRDLLGFIKRWHAQLCIHARIVCSSVEDSQVEREPSIWEDADLNSALAREVDGSLTLSQISGLFTEHSTHIASALEIVVANSEKLSTSVNGTVYRNACGSSIILDALLDCPFSYQTVEGLKPQFQKLQAAYTTLVHQKAYRSTSDLALVWKILSKLFALLWPIDIHGSSSLQETHRDSGIVTRAIKDTTVTPKHKNQTDISRIRASALIFLFSFCHSFQTIPTWEEVVTEWVNRAIPSLARSNLELIDFNEAIEALITRFPSLLRYLEPNARKTLFLDIFSNTFISNTTNITEQLRNTCSEFVFSSCRPDIKDYSASFAAVMDSNSSGKNAANNGIERTFIQIPPASLTRDQRASALDEIVDTLIKRPRDVDMMLSLMAHFVQVPNATAKISQNASVLFDIAQSLHDGGFDSDRAILQIFQTVTQLTLGHVFQAKDQARNQQYIEKLKNKLGTTIQKPRKCFPAKLTILRACMLARSDETVLSWDQYLGVLNSCVTAKDSAISLDDFLDALNEMPSEVLQQHGLIEKEQAFVRAQFSSKVDIETLFNSESFSLGTFSYPTWLRLHRFFARFHVYPAADKCINVSLGLLQQGLSAKEHRVAIESARNAVISLSITDKLRFVSLLLENDDGKNRVEKLRLLFVLASTLEDDVPKDTEQRQQLLAILPTLSNSLATSPDITTFNVLLDSIDLFLHDKPSLTSQYSIECVIAAVTTILSPRSPAFPKTHAPAIFDRLCATIRLILVLHRGRFGGRFHILNLLLQSFLFCFFVPNSARWNNLPRWLKAEKRAASSTRPKLTASNAAYFTRLLTTVCSPTPSSVTRNAHQRKQSHFEDPVKKARSYASQHLTPLISFFCKMQLSGRLEPDVREKLMPGFWEVFEVSSMDMEGLRGMNAGMDEATKAIWKGLWEEWNRVTGKGGKRKEGL